MEMENNPCGKPVENLWKNFGKTVEKLVKKPLYFSTKIFNNFFHITSHKNSTNFSTSPYLDFKGKKDFSTEKIGIIIFYFFNYLRNLLKKIIKVKGKKNFIH